MRSSHIRLSLMFTVLCSLLNVFLTNQQNDQLSVGLLAQLVEHCTGDAIAQVMFMTAKSTFIFRNVNSYSRAWL